MKSLKKVITSAVLAATLVFGMVGCTNTSQQPEEEAKEPTKQEETTDKYEGYSNPKSIVSATQLNEMKDDEKVVVVDFRDAKLPGNYIPGAVKIKRDDIAQEIDGVSGMLVDKAQMEKVLSDSGISNDSTVVVYDDENELWASRLWWAMKVYGHEDVRLLDGGLKSWKAAGLETDSSATTKEATEYKAKAANEELVADLEMIKKSFDDESYVVLDTRSEDEYKAGRIPGATWIEWTNALNEDGTFKSSDELKKLYEEKGITPDKAAIMPHCKSAVRAAHTMFVLQELLGYDNVKNYDGSWLEYEKSGLEIEK